jgi:hypothetical protein
MNWGKGIMIGMGLFIAFIVTLVIILMGHRVDLESEDYYQKEINYESELTSMKNADELAQQVELLEKKDFIVIQLPEKGEFKDLSVEFIRPDNDKLDKTFDISGTRSFLINRKDLTKGKYNVEIEYSFEGNNCLQKQTIYI